MSLPFSDTAELFNTFIGQKVSVETEERITVHGKLLHYERGKKENHAPPILIIETLLNRTIIRGNWLIIKKETIHLLTSSSRILQ